MVTVNVLACLLPAYFHIHFHLEKEKERFHFNALLSIELFVLNESEVWKCDFESGATHVNGSDN